MIFSFFFSIYVFTLGNFQFITNVRQAKYHINKWKNIGHLLFAAVSMYTWITIERHNRLAINSIKNEDHT